MHTQSWRRSPLHARDGSGTYSLRQAAFTPGTTIETAKVNSDFSDIAAGLTQSISKDGQTVYTASQPMGGFKLTGLGIGTGTGESARYDELMLAARSMLSGLTLSRTSATVVGVAAGACAESGNTAIISLSSSGSIDCATVGANGLDAGSLANSTWYHAYAIMKADGTAARLASTSVSSPTMPSGYTLKRRIGSFKTNGSAQIIDFVQDGDLYQWVTPTQDIVAANPGTGDVTRTLNVPTGVNVVANVQLVVTNTGTGGSSGAYLRDLATVTIVPGAGTGVGDTPSVAASAGNVAVSGSRVSVRTNTSAQIGSRLAFSDASCQLIINTLGWTDRRGKDA